MGLSLPGALRAPERAPAPVIRRAAGLTVGHGGVPILRGIDLEIAGGQSLAVVGANGCGKTTLLRALAGLLSPLAGTLTWPAGAPPSGTGMLLPQDEPVAPFSVRELVTLGLGRDGPPSVSERARVDGALADLGLTRLAARPCTQISGGEWQRARLARALIARPPLILFDEPTNHLDPAARAELLATIPSSCSPWSSSAFACALSGAGSSVVLATHDLDLAARCDQVLLLAAGGALASGAPAAALTPLLLTRALGIPIARHLLPGDPIPVFRAEVLR